MRPDTSQSWSLIVLMKRSNPTEKPPRRRRNAELILRECYRVGSKGPGFPEGLAPQRVVLGNATGFRWLAAYFAWLADRSRTLPDPPEGDPGHHVQLWEAPVPCNLRLSDEASRLFLTLTARNRRTVLRRYAVPPRNQMQGTPLQRFCTFLRHLRLAVDCPAEGDGAHAPEVGSV